MLTATCGKCHLHHASVNEARDCYFERGRFAPAPPTPAVEQVRLATRRQLDYISDLNGDAVHAAKLTIREASDYIKRLQKDRRMYTPNAPAPEPPYELPWPSGLLDTMPDQARFAVRRDESEQYSFYYVSRPKSGQYAGCIKVQSKHSERYELVMVRWPNGTDTYYRKDRIGLMVLFLIDPATAARNFARESDSCGICGKELTQGRSLWFGVGPECESKGLGEDIINAVLDESGDYVPGASHHS